MTESKKPYYDIPYFIDNNIKVSDIHDGELLDAFLERRMHYMIVDVAITDELLRKADASKLFDMWVDEDITSSMFKRLEYALKQAVK